MPARTIFKGNGARSKELESLLQTVFACEVLAPSSEFWIVSPWITDVVVLDNTTGSFSGACPDWGRRGILLTEVLQRLVVAGGEIYVATRALPHNELFRHRLRSAAMDVGASSQIHVEWDEEELLHEKGILGEGYCIVGSMNLTESGVRVNDEQIRYSTAEDDVAELRVHFSNRYGR